ncbi:fimbria/pilus outer membrane usher protein [Enterobacter asburiae]|uniref:fimbria/pilus outer membrane usher protein n=1 Tax=Enterobacter asburiae TaxID=61645 RepID=UPI00192C1317|nr:fimbria/pilus outer membrane usher protein [Enterobacter asburiae]MBL5841313.1 fimbrial biogenesis outer membrane usher protein [Enterobacter asburiae]MBL5941706.1 fimbrial biogenesis outer membrane usher protein [Enterobacter asburiae]MBL5963534.1 fimbrial biogenesis outer membrane usher protein [Enterobacter asburiae]MBL5972111.1 fimbrial biogenesis outer membrane usher protein [Enterobacter asburiae]
MKIQTKSPLLLGRKKIALFVALQCGLMLPGQAHARDAYSQNLLELGNPDYKSIDLSAFNSGAQMPGTYRVDVVVNSETVETTSVDFVLIKDATGQQTLQPCLSVAQLQQYGVKTELFPQLGQGKCVDLSAIPQAAARFRFNEQRLELSFPHAALSRSAKGAVSPERYDQGIPALLLNYSLSGANASTGGQNSNTQYANLRPGINLGPWRLRNYTTWNRDAQGNSEWNTVYTYARRDIIQLKSQLVLGDASSPSDIFDSVPFRGAQMASDDDMLPDSLRGYAPVVRGIARTNAQVVVRQNGYVVYDSFVPPGPFEITDLYPTGSGGDLNVTIKESNGSEQHLVVPYASVPLLQREGQLKYSLTSGQYRSYDHSVDTTPFTQGTLIYGLPHGLTAYGGVQGASKYQSMALGLGTNMGLLGALSADLTQSWATLNGSAKERGQSWRVRYSKSLSDFGTYFALAGYRYSTEGFRSLNEVLETYRDAPNTSFTERRRNRAELSVSQQLWEGAGSLSLNAVREDYWDANTTMRSVGMGYSNSWNSISYSMNYSHNTNTPTSAGARSETNESLFSLNISVPMDRLLKNTWASYNLSQSDSGGTSHNIGLNGVALADNRLSWGVLQGMGQGGSNTTNLNSTYRGNYGEVTAGYSRDSNQQQMNYGLNGGVLVHQNGVTLGQPFGETIALVKVPDAAGIDVANQQGVHTDYRGYAVVPYLTPYRVSSVALTTETLDQDVELPKTIKSVVPTRGAVVRAEFVARSGSRVLMTLRQSDNTPVPFGAMVGLLNDPGDQGSIVGDGGDVYLSGLPQKGALLVKWGRELSQRCQADYTLPASKPEYGVHTMSAVCRR